MRWSVSLSGDTTDLEELAKALNNGFATIRRQELHQSGAAIVHEFRLESELFDSISNYDSLIEKAEEFVGWLNGGIRLALDSRKPIKISGVERIDGDDKKTLFVSFIETNEPRDLVSFSTTDKNGETTVFNVADPVREWIRLADRDSNVATLFRLIAGKSLDWVGLYRIYEVILKDVGNKDAIVKNGWATEASLGRFKHTANSPASIGDEARHGKETTAPPTKPMNFSEARSLVENIIHNWLNSK